MKKITHIQGQVIPLGMNEVDTDLIIPAQFLTSVSKIGYGAHLFERLRQQDPGFVLNNPTFARGKILLSGENFGCGSSREHAVWAIQQWGIEAVVAVSFADIFRNNSGKNGLVLVTLSKEDIQELLQEAQERELTLDIHLENTTLATPKKVYSFTMDSFIQHCFVNGLDELDYLMSKTEQINRFREKQRKFA